MIEKTLNDNLGPLRIVRWLVVLTIVCKCGFVNGNQLAASAKEVTAKAQATKEFSWPNGTLGAVTLSYDDAIRNHYEYVAPSLDRNALRATFYVTIDRAGFTQNPQVWRRVARVGHELGNHSLFHPCRKEHPDEHTWLPDEYNLCDYTARRWLREMLVANFALQLIDGKTERTFGNTCCDNYIGRADDKLCLEQLVPQLFVAARGEFLSKTIDPSRVNFANLGHYSGDRKTFERLRNEIESAVREGKWIFYMFHGVGKVTHSLYIEKGEHDKLLKYLGENKHRIWTAPAVDVVKYIKQYEDQKISDDTVQEGLTVGADEG